MVSYLIEQGETTLPELRTIAKESKSPKLRELAAEAAAHQYGDDELIAEHLSQSALSSDLHTLRMEAVQKLIQLGDGVTAKIEEIAKTSRDLRVTELVVRELEKRGNSKPAMEFFAKKARTAKTADERRQALAELIRMGEAARPHVRELADNAPASEIREIAAREMAKHDEPEFLIRFMTDKIMHAEESDAAVADLHKLAAIDGGEEAIKTIARDHPMSIVREEAILLIAAVGKSDEAIEYYFKIVMEAKSGAERRRALEALFVFGEDAEDYIRKIAEKNSYPEIRETAAIKMIDFGDLDPAVELYFEMTMTLRSEYDRKKALEKLIVFGEAAREKLQEIAEHNSSKEIREAAKAALAKK